MSRAFHRFWLKVTAIVVGSFGPVFFLGAMMPSSAPARLTLDLLGWRSLRQPVERCVQCGGAGSGARPNVAPRTSFASRMQRGTEWQLS